MRNRFYVGLLLIAGASVLLYALVQRIPAFAFGVDVFAALSILALAGMLVNLGKGWLSAQAEDTPVNRWKLRCDLLAAALALASVGVLGAREYKAGSEEFEKARTDSYVALLERQRTGEIVRRLCDVERKAGIEAD